MPPSERVQQAYGLFQKTFHHSANTQPAPNPYGYSSVPPPPQQQQQSSWHQAGPPPPPPVLADSIPQPTQLSYNSPPMPPPYQLANVTAPPLGHSFYEPNTQPPPLPPRPFMQHSSAWSPQSLSASTFQPAQPSAHPIYRKYGHMLQGSQDQPWQQPVPPVSPPAYSYTNTPQRYTTTPQPPPPPPPPPPGPPPQTTTHPDYFQHALTTVTSGGGSPQVSPFTPFTPDAKDDSRVPFSPLSNSEKPPVSPPVPNVSPLVSRQGSLASQYARAGWQSRHERADTVSSISTTAGGGLANAATGGWAGGSKAEMSASASALGFGGGLGFEVGFSGGPGGWEYYAPLGDGKEESEDEAKVEGRKSQIQEKNDGRVSPEVAEVAAVELPSEGVGVKKEDAQAGAKKDGESGEWINKKEDDVGIYELPGAESWMEATIKPAEEPGSEAAYLPLPSSRYNRIPRPQDLIPDLGPWYASSLERYVAMLKAEAYASSDELRAAAFTDFVAAESQIRGVPYYSQPDQKKPQLPLYIPPQTADEHDVEYSPGGRPILRRKPSGPVTAVKEDAPLYKPFRKDTSDKPEPTTQKAYKPYILSTPSTDTSQSTTSPPLNADTFFPAPLAPRHKKDAAPPATSPPLSPSRSPLSPPLFTAEEAASLIPFPTSPFFAPSTTSTPPDALIPAPLAPAPLSLPPTTSRPAPRGLPRLKSLLSTTTPSPTPPDLALLRTTLTTALPPLFPSPIPPPSSSSPPTAAQTLHTTLLSARTDAQVQNDMAFESHELSYPELLARDDAQRTADAARAATEAQQLGAAAERAYAAWERETWAGAYARVRGDVGRGVEGWGLVEGVGEKVAGGLRGGQRGGGGGGIVKINAGTGEVVVVEGLGAAAKGEGEKSAGAVLDKLTVLAAAADALVAVHRGIAARHALLAQAVAARDGAYAAAQLAGLEFAVAFEALENPAAAKPAPSTTNNKPGKGDAGAGKETAAGKSDEKKSPQQKLAALRRHFADARRGAARRAAGEEEGRARQTWERVRAWMECGVGAVTGVVGEVAAAVEEMEMTEEGEELLARAEEVVAALVEKGTQLVRAFWEAEVLLNEAEFGVGVEGARRGEGEGEGEDERVARLEEERAREDGVLRAEMEARVGALEKEQMGRVREAVGRLRAK